MTDSNEVIIVEPEEEIVLCSSAYYKEAVKINSREIYERMLLAQRIIRSTKEKADRKQNKDANYPSIPLLAKLIDYTKLPEGELRSIQSNIGTRDRSFRNAFKNIAFIDDQTLEYLCDDIRTILVSFYVYHKKLPAKLSLLTELKSKADLYMNEDLSIQKLVRNKLVKYHHFPTYNRYLLMEHPENVYKRTVYLRTLEEHRKQGRNIVYVDLRKLMNVTNPTFYVGLALLPRAYQLEKFLARDLSDTGPAKWLTSRVIPNIPPNSVVVLYQTEKMSKKLQPHSRRKTMMEWLDNNNISYGKNPHTAEVYALYKAHEKKVKEAGLFDHLFTKAGIDVINCSKKWLSLNCFMEAWKIIYSKYEKNDRNKLTMEYFKDEIIKATNWMTHNVELVEKKLIEAEKKVIMEDVAMENLLENLLEMVENGDIGLKEFPGQNCGDKTDNFETHICDIILSSPH